MQDICMSISHQICILWHNIHFHSGNRAVISNTDSATTNIKLLDFSPNINLLLCVFFISGKAIPKTVSFNLTLRGKFINLILCKYHWVLNNKDMIYYTREIWIRGQGMDSLSKCHIYRELHLTIPLAQTPMYINTLNDFICFQTSESTPISTWFWVPVPAWGVIWPHSALCNMTGQHPCLHVTDLWCCLGSSSVVITAPAAGISCFPRFFPLHHTFVAK